MKEKQEAPTSIKREGRHSKTRELVIIAMLGAITMLLGVSGYGFINLGFMKATILQVPAVIGALVEGPRVGAAVGFLFGVFSLYQNLVVPNVFSFVFLNPAISVLPRIFIGPVAYIVYRTLPLKNETLRLALGGFVGSLYNTIAVLGAIYLFYGQEAAMRLHIPLANVGKTLLGIGIANGIPEAIITSLIVGTVVYMVKRNIKK